MSFWWSFYKSIFASDRNYWIFIMIISNIHRYLHNFRLVKSLWQRKDKEKRRCDCQNKNYSAETENTRYHFNSASESKIWTISERQIPVYKDFDIENFRQKNKRDSNQERNSSNIIYDYITAKEVAQFRPCSLSSFKNGE